MTTQPIPIPPQAPPFHTPPAPVKAGGWGVPIACAVGIVVVAAAALRLEGRIWWCECGEIGPWRGDVWTKHCSQHLSDPYTITHLSHGLILYWFFAAVAKRWREGWRLCATVGVAGAWEVLENSAMVINRYRTVTMSLDYLGDSIVNATGDIVAAGLGFFVARALGWKLTLALFVAAEIVLLILIRDNLTLNVIMLITPIEAIKNWQAAGHVPV